MRASLKHLSTGVAIYGAAEPAVQIVKIFLLAVYVKNDILVEADYGALGLIVAIEMLMKMLSRWGLDGAFMRFFHDREESGTLARLTSTIVWFTVAANALVFALAMAASGAIAAAWFPHPTYLVALRLVLINTFLMGFTYLPFQLMRLRNQRVAYSALVFARSAGTVAVQALLVLGFGWGLAGWFAADLVLTIVLLPLLMRWLLPLIRREFCGEDLRAALRFGLPRLPHGLAQQALDAGNRILLGRFIPLDRLGVYTNAFTLGTGLRLFTSAFETAWAPFYYSTARQPDGRQVLAKMATYAIAALALLVALTVAVARDLVPLILTPAYADAADVIPIIALALALQGVYLLTSIGLNLTSRTAFYPVATFAALGVGLGAGFAWMPTLGIHGAALAFLASTATQTTVAFVLARRFYRIEYETGRIGRVVAAAVIAAVAGRDLLPALTPLAGVAARSALVIGIFSALLAASGFLRRTERAFVAEAWTALRRRTGFRAENAS